MMDLNTYPGKEREQMTMISHTALPKPARPNPSRPCNQIPTMWSDFNPRIFHTFIWDVRDKDETENGGQCEQSRPTRLKSNAVLEAAALSSGRAASQKGSGEEGQAKAESWEPCGQKDHLHRLH